MKTFKSRKISWAVVVQSFNPNTQKREAGQSESEFQNSKTMSEKRKRAEK